jgi:hypothetical protein
MSKEEIAVILFLMIFSVIVTIKFILIDINFSKETTSYNLIYEKFLK